MKRTKAQNIQQGITQKLKQLVKQNTFTQKDFECLYERTHELYNLAKEAGKLEEIKAILERGKL